MLKPLMGKELAIGDACLHRLVKEMVKAEVQGGQNLHFCKSISNLIFKDFDKVLATRGVFVILELYENEKTKDLVQKQLQENKMSIINKAKNDKAPGL